MDDEEPFSWSDTLFVAALWYLLYDALNAQYV